MNNIKEKWLALDMKKAFRRLAIYLVLVVLLGGAACGVALRTQLGEAYTAIITQESTEASQLSEPETENEASFGNRNPDTRDMKKDRHHEKAELEDLISEPAWTAKLTVGIVGVLLAIGGATYWLLIAIQLFRLSVAADMSPMLWFLLGMAANLAALLLFLLVREHFRTRCLSCGVWQKSGCYCGTCGKKLVQPCPSCGAECKDKYCRSCGAMVGSEKKRNDEDE